MKYLKFKMIKKNFIFTVVFKITFREVFIQERKK